jgi:hypothetical protein
MGILFVTSFTPEMFAVTGTRLVRSFLETKSQGTLLICHEGFQSVAPFKRRGLRTFDVNRAALLEEWLTRNRDVIPRRFGGSAGLCQCPEPRNPLGRHRPRCPSSWFNRNAARWFRKIVSLDYAIHLPHYKYIVWLDSDCVFKARLPESEVRQWFLRKAVFYLKSGARKVIESGVIGVRNTHQGRKFIAATVDRYRSGAFRQDPRWDDGYQFQLALRSHPEIPAVDLATRAAGKALGGHVLSSSAPGRYIFHQKGIHASMLGLLK